MYDTHHLFRCQFYFQILFSPVFHLIYFIVEIFTLVFDFVLACLLEGTDGKMVLLTTNKTGLIIFAPCSNSSSLTQVMRLFRKLREITRTFFYRFPSLFSCFLFFCCYCFIIPLPPPFFIPTFSILDVITSFTDLR